MKQVPVFQDTYNIQTNFLTYHGVITAIRFYIKKSNIPINDLEKLNGPLIPNLKLHLELPFIFLHILILLNLNLKYGTCLLNLFEIS
jgi:hypothetical protein